MSTDLTALIPADTVGRARDLLISLGIHALPVMEGNEVVGIVTSTDLVDNWAEDTAITDIMTTIPTTISREATVREAAKLMITNRIHHLLVRDEREVIGILSSFDLLDTLTSDQTSDEA